MIKAILLVILVEYVRLSRLGDASKEAAALALLDCI